MKDERDIIKNETGINDTEKEVASDVINNRLHESVIGLENTIDDIEGTNQKIESLLNDENLSEEEKREYEREFDLIKKDTLNFKDRLKKLGERVLEGVAKGINSTIESYSDRFGENRKKVKTIEFILDNLDIENKEDLRAEFEKKKASHNLWGVHFAEFPLNDEGAKLLKMVSSKQRELKYFYSLEDLIKKTNQIYSFNKKNNISLECLMKIDIRHTFNFDRVDENTIEKIRIIDKSGVYREMNEFSLYNLDDISSEQLKILINNKYIKFKFENNDFYYLKDLVKIINEENLIKAQVFFKNIREVKINDFILFVNKISNYDIRLQDLIKEEFVNKNYSLNNLSYDKVFETFNTLDGNKIDLLIYLVKKGYIRMTNSYELKKIDKFNHDLIYKIDSLEGLGYKNLEYYLDELNTLSETEFNIFIDIFKGFKDKIYINFNEIRSISKTVYKSFGNDYKWFIDIINRLDIHENIRVMGSSEDYLQKIKDYSDWVNSDKDIDLITLSNKAFGNNTSRGLETFDIGDIKKGIMNNNYNIINNSFINFNYVSKVLSEKGIVLSKDEENIMFNNVLNCYPNILTEEYEFTLDKQQKRSALNIIIVKEPLRCVININFIRNKYSDVFDKEGLNNLFNSAIQSCPLDLLNSKDFPFTPEQQRYIDLFKIMTESQSAELKNLSDQIIPMLAKYKNIEEAKKVLGGIEQIFLSNNIPLVGKQYKVFELMYGDKELDFGVNRSKVESLKNVKDNSKRRLIIFKDLLRSHIASCDENLYSYLQFLSENRSVISRFQSGESVSDEERQKIKFFIKKINVLSGHIGRYSLEIEDNLSDNTLKSELESISQAFGVKEGSDIISRFEQAFLRRVDIGSVEQALQKMDEYKQNAHQRNILNSSQGVIKIKQGDMIKGISSNFIDTYLDKGVYSPEFIGAETDNAKSTAKSSDLTPFDTDLSIFESEALKEGFTGYGDMYLILKQKEQFEKDELDIFKTGVINDKHYGIRTGFGSTNIDAICIDGEGFENVKYFIAQKGFYIPICNAEGKVTFTLDDFNRYKKTFAGTHKSKETVTLSDEWKKHTEISESKQTEENIESITRVKDKLIDKIKLLLEENGILFHKGEYDDSLLGAIITDTGSTGRGSALDEKFDFDFAVKLDDKDWGKVNNLMVGIESIFEKSDSYENRGMQMFRSKELEMDGHKMTVDIGFVKKSDSATFDAHSGLHEKYDSIEKTYGKEKLLDVLTNIRYAKKKLKEAECYKKGLGNNGQQGGLGGIGVEYWILQNGGDAIKAFKDFVEVAYDNNQLIPFEEFKKKYKIFSAGQNIRGGIKVENFVYNMTPEGFEKMSRLALELTQ